MKKILTAVLSLLLVLVTLLSGTSCAIRISAEELSAGYSRTATEEGEVTEAFRAAMANFSLTLFRGLITKDDKNDLVSPLSAILCLAMIANGAEGETRAQIETAFGMDIDTLNRSLYAYTSSLYRADDCKVNVADSIWFRNDQNALSVREDFLQTNADWYDAQIYAAPFDESTLQDINAWCKKNTDGMIDKILDRIDAETVMYLVNALVFDAEWEKKYEKSAVSDWLFQNEDKTETSVKMLSSEESIYFENENLTGFAKNYVGGKYSIVGLLPNIETDIYDCIASLDGAGWLALWEGRRHETVKVMMPEFTYSDKTKLNDVLTAMGMEDMFVSDKADFSGIGTSPLGNIYCSEICQKTFIQVDRNGTKAAAITWGNMKGESCEPDFHFVTLDRPFIYAIVDNATGLPLFLGAVTGL